MFGDNPITAEGVRCAKCNTKFKAGELVFKGCKCWSCCREEDVAMDGRPYCPPPPKDTRNVEALRLAYKKVRIDAGLTLRDAASILDVTPQQLSLIEFGPPPKFVWSEEGSRVVTCGVCAIAFKARLLVCEENPEFSPAFPIWEKMCSNCAKICEEHNHERTNETTEL